MIFLHGWGATEPRFYGPWLEHLARAGNAVVYPRYQQSVAEPPAQVLGNAQAGIRVAFDGLDLDRDGLVVAGHSAGGALAADYAAIAARADLPPPRAVLSMYPGRSFRGIDVGIPSAGPVPAGVTLRVLTRRAGQGRRSARRAGDRARRAHGRPPADPHPRRGRRRPPRAAARHAGRAARSSGRGWTG